MTVYAVMENDKMEILFSSLLDAFNHARYLADRTVEHYRLEASEGADISVKREGNKIIVEDHYDHDYDEVWNYWVKSVDVIGKLKS